MAMRKGTCTPAPPNFAHPGPGAPILNNKPVTRAHTCGIPVQRVMGLKKLCGLDITPVRNIVRMSGSGREIEVRDGGEGEDVKGRGDGSCTDMQPVCVTSAVLSRGVQVDRQGIHAAINKFGIKQASRIEMILTSKANGWVSVEGEHYRTPEWTCNTSPSLPCPLLRTSKLRKRGRKKRKHSLIRPDPRHLVIAVIAARHARAPTMSSSSSAPLPSVFSPTQPENARSELRINQRGVIGNECGWDMWVEGVCGECVREVEAGTREATLIRGGSLRMGGGWDGGGNGNGMPPVTTALGHRLIEHTFPPINIKIHSSRKREGTSTARRAHSTQLDANGVESSAGCAMLFGYQQAAAMAKQLSPNAGADAKAREGGGAAETPGFDVVCCVVTDSEDIGGTENVWRGRVRREKEK
ncbi:hypothetical protein R3P38DRAFT_2794964 [Favolaschia claudopus]|uniref:Uncharacterized protein n=1 Tax=Favolaschia claudopus TaxID=2862362 RepID=A0AAW0A8Z4_9AGAR